MSWPTLENCRIAARSITTIRGWGGAEAASASVGTRTNARASVFFMVLESRGTGEMNELGAIILGFYERQAQIDLNRAKRRFPADTDAGRGAERHIVPDAGTDLRMQDTGAGIGGFHVEPAQGAEIGEKTGIDAIAFRQERGQPRLDGTDGKDRAAQGTGVLGRIDVARPHARQGEAAEGIAADELAV